jgi:hypothetical protein
MIKSNQISTVCENIIIVLVWAIGLRGRQDLLVRNVTKKREKSRQELRSRMYMERRHSYGHVKKVTRPSLNSCWHGRISKLMQTMHAERQLSHGHVEKVTRPSLNRCWRGRMSMLMQKIRTQGRHLSGQYVKTRMV